MTTMPIEVVPTPPAEDRTPVPYHRGLYRAFQRTRLEQARQHGRELTAVNTQAARVVFETGVRAMIDVETTQMDTRHSAYPVMRVASLATGSGKSTSAEALVAACCSYYNDTFMPRDSFSAAFVVPTVQLAKETVGEIQRLMPEGEKVALWSRQEDTVEGDRASLSDYRVVVYCHEAWRRAMVAKEIDGLRFYKGKRRKLVFVDEQPELVQHVHIRPSHIEGFYEDVRATCPDHPIAPVLSKIVGRMNKLLGSAGQRFAPVVSLLSEAEGGLFSDLTSRHLESFVSRDLSHTDRANRLVILAQLRDFLTAASRGGCFYSRQSKMFTAFKFDFHPGPGHVLLDATADLSGLTQLRADIAHVDVPTISYANLKAVLVTIPKRWRRTRDLLTKLERKEAVEYGDWVRSVIVQHSKPGDGVLMFAALGLYQAAIFDKAPDASKPIDLQGRLVNTEHHGSGVGRNEWRNKSVVAVVGHHFLPRHITVANTHGWSGEGLTERRLKRAEGRREYGDIYKPEGDYGTVHEGHALRWVKQETMRINGRNITSEGVCGEMTAIIFTSDPNMVLNHWHALYPGAPLPTPHDSASTPTSVAPGATGKGYEEFARFLQTFEGALEDSLSIAQRFGIPSRNLPVALRSPALKTIADAYGWSVAKAKLVNKPGRANWLVNWKRYGLAMAEANADLVSKQSGLSAAA